MGYLFISYERSDREYVDQLAAEARINGIEVWFDRDIDSGAHWADVIDAQVRSCDAFAPMLTPDSVDSDWCKRELLRADELRKPIFPVLVRTTTTPLLLIDLQQYDGRRHLPDKGWFSSVSAVVAPSPVSAPDTDRVESSAEALAAYTKGLSEALKKIQF